MKLMNLQLKFNEKGIHWGLVCLAVKAPKSVEKNVDRKVDL